MGYIIFLAPILLQVICVVHAVRHGRVFPWIYVIVFLPLIGSIIYIGMEIMPDLMGGREARRLKSAVTTLADPHRNLRAAQREVELSGSVDARRTLAEEYVKRGQFADAIALYQSALEGHFRDDPVLLLGLARAQFQSGDGAGAQASLDALQAADAKFVSTDAHLIYARALELQGKEREALDEYSRLVRYFPGEEARCRYAMLLEKTGDSEQAREIFAQVTKSLDGAPRHYRSAQKEWGAIAKRALSS